MSTSTRLFSISFEWFFFLVHLGLSSAPWRTSGTFLTLGRGRLLGILYSFLFFVIFLSCVCFFFVVVFLSFVVAAFMSVFPFTCQLGGSFLGRSPVLPCPFEVLLHEFDLPGLCFAPASHQSCVIGYGYGLRKL